MKSCAQVCVFELAKLQSAGTSSATYPRSKAAAAAYIQARTSCGISISSLWTGTAALSHFITKTLTGRA